MSYSPTRPEPAFDLSGWSRHFEGRQHGLTARQEAALLLGAQRLDAAWLEEVLQWLLSVEPERRNLRMMALEMQIRESPQSELVQQKIADAWREMPMVRFLAEAGVPEDSTAGSSFWTRLDDVYPPRVGRARDLRSLLQRAGVRDQDAVWLLLLPQQRVLFWERTLLPVREVLGDAAKLVARRASGSGLQPEMLDLLSDQEALASPFFRLPAVVAAWAEEPESAEARAEFEQCITTCLNTAELCVRTLEETAGSIRLRVRAEILIDQLERIRDLLLLQAGEGDAQGFAASLMRGVLQQRRSSSVWRTSATRLARKAMPRRGGKCSTVKWSALLRLGAGGGLVAALVVILQSLIGQMRQAPGLEALLEWASYFAGFLTIQLAGFCFAFFASRRPSVSGSTLAKKAGSRPERRVHVENIAAICRAQVSVTLGNLIVVAPVAAILSTLWTGGWGSTPVSYPEAQKMVKDLMPGQWWNLLPMASLTGVALWIAGLVSGWASNWSADRRLPERRFGYWTGQRTAELVRRNWSAIVGYGVLGFLFVLAPVVTHVSGIELAARHVTFETGSFAIACHTLWLHGGLRSDQILWGAGAILLIALLNFGVWFLLWIRTAMQALGIPAAERRRLWKELFRTMWREPGSFVRPAAAVQA